MAINKNGVYLPDFEADMQMPQMADMGQPDQVNIQPAVGAFQQRFMGGQKGGAGDMRNVPNPMSEGLPMDMNGPNAGGGAPLKKGLGKSL